MEGYDTAALADGIRMARAKRRWTQPQLAEAAGLTKPTIVRVEAGRPCSARTLLKIAAALQLTVEELFEIGDRVALPRH